MERSLVLRTLARSLPQPPPGPPCPQRVFLAHSREPVRAERDLKGKLPSRRVEMPFPGWEPPCDDKVSTGRRISVGILYIGIGAILLLWGGFQFRGGLKPFRLRPFLLSALGLLMLYQGLRMERYLP